MPLTIGIVLTLTLVGDTLDLAVADDQRGPLRSPPGAGRRGPADGRRRARVRAHRLGAAADPRGDDRGHLADRQRGRAVPRGRAGRVVADRPRRPADRDVRLVQPRRVRRDRDGGAGARACSARRCWARAGAGRRLPRRSSSATRSSGSRWPSGSGGSAPGIEAPPAATSDDGIRRRLGLGRSRGVVLRLSVLFSLDAFGGGFIPQSLDGLLVPRPVRRRAGGPRA